jgi:hypothetical protein
VVERSNDAWLDRALAEAHATPLPPSPALMARVEADALRWLPPAQPPRAVGWRAWWVRARPVWPGLAVSTACACALVVALAWPVPSHNEAQAWQEMESWAWEAEVHEAWMAWESSS